MSKRLTINLSDEIYECLRQHVGRRRISRFIDVLERERLTDRSAPDYWLGTSKEELTAAHEEHLRWTNELKVPKHTKEEAMSRYWIVAPFESEPRDRFDKVWRFDLDNNLISIGWKDLGDVSKMSRDQLLQAVASTYPTRPPQTKSLIANMVWAFYHDISPDDLIIARRGRKYLVGIGRVSKAASYAPGKNQFCDHPSFLEVVWQSEPRDKEFSTIAFPMHTLAETSEQHIHSLMEGSALQPFPLERQEAVEDPSEFVLERYLEDFIVSNFQTIFKNGLAIYKDAEGNDGQQYATDIGAIDILAFEPESKSFVVIELKKGRPSDQVMGQILRYMGWVKTTLCSNNEGVKGLIICRDADAKLDYALKMTGDIDVRYYNVSFKLTEIPQTQLRTET